MAEEYIRANVMSDMVIRDEEGRILLIRRGRSPFEGKWALPGGFLDVGEETVEECAVREAEEETGLHVEIDRLLGVWSKPGRDPRRPSVSCVYLSRPIPADLAATAEGRDDAAEAQWWNLQDTPPEQIDLAFDHEEILLAALKFMRNDP